MRPPVKPRRPPIRLPIRPRAPRPLAPQGRTRSSMPRPPMRERLSIPPDFFGEGPTQPQALPARPPMREHPAVPPGFFGGGNPQPLSMPVGRPQAIAADPGDYLVPEMGGAQQLPWEGVMRPGGVEGNRGLGGYDRPSPGIPSMDAFGSYGGGPGAVPKGRFNLSQDVLNSLLEMLMRGRRPTGVTR